MTSAINRYYDPTTGQFLSIDPDVADTNQPYVFTNDDPLNSDDPEGLLPGRYSDKYPEGDLQNEITRYLGPNVDVQSGRSADKIIFSDANDPSKQVVYDVDDNYFRIVKVSNGEEEYYDRENDTWGTNEQLGNVGKGNSHYANTGESYDSVDAAANQFDVASGGDGGDGGDFGGFGDAGLFLLFPSVSQLAPKPPKSSHA